MEDALRVLLMFSEQRQSMEAAGWQSPALQSALPILSFCVQFGGSLLVVLSACASHRAVVGCYTLLGWCLFHPFMYQQQTNWDFVLETATIMGGLLILLSHEQLNAQASAAAFALPGDSKPPEARKERANQLQMVGRVFITAIFLYYAFSKVQGYAPRVKISVDNHYIGTPLIQGLLVVLLLCMSMLVIVGMKSRWCALLLALVMACSAFYMHPFWAYVFSKETYRIDGVPGMDGAEVEAYVMADHQRYFFFQRMSTVGALLLLVVHGPGNFSMDEQHGTTETMLKSIERKSYS
jgi:uncharacterized membrane protein YphA (DoxX/SURF4 family)